MTEPKLPKLAKGLDLLDEVEGEGSAATKGDEVVFNMKIWLNRGEEVPLNALQSQHLPEQMIRIVGNEKLIDHKVVLGARKVIPGVEHALAGMKRGGYRKVRVSWHLAYRDKGLPGLIPERAVLVVELWVREILPAAAPMAAPVQD